MLGMAPVDTCCAPFAALRVAAASGDLSQEFATESDWAMVFTLQGGQVVRYRADADTAAMGIAFRSLTTYQVELRGLGMLPAP